MQIDSRATDAADEIMAEHNTRMQKTFGYHGGNEGAACQIDLAMTELREGVHRINAMFTLERGTPGEDMRRKAIHAAVDVLLDEDDPLMSLALTTPRGKA